MEKNIQEDKEEADDGDGSIHHDVKKKARKGHADPNTWKKMINKRKREKGNFLRTNMIWSKALYTLVGPYAILDTDFEKKPNIFLKIVQEKQK